MAFEDELAAAMLAKLAATELSTIDSYTTQQSSAGRANKLDPVSFVTSLKTRKEAEERNKHQAYMEHMNRQAELAHPLPVAASLPPLEMLPVTVQPQSTVISNSISEDNINLITKSLTDMVKELATLNSIITDLVKTHKNSDT